MKQFNLCSVAHNSWRLRRLPDGEWIEASVPSTLYHDLHRGGLLPDPFYGTNETAYAFLEETDWEYQGIFHWKASDTSEHVDIVFQGLDTLAEIELNDHLIGRSENMFLPLRLSVRNFLRDGTNILTIRFPSFNPFIREASRHHRNAEWLDPVGGSSNLRKQACSFGWDWAPRLPSRGPWLPIHLEAWNGTRLGWIRIRQEHKPSSVILRANSEAECTGETVRLRLFDPDGTGIAETTDGQLHLESPQLWWPAGMGDSPLYLLIIERIIDGNVVEKEERKIGLRSLELQRLPDGEGETFRFAVNGVPFFAKGANWIPAHSYPSEVAKETYRDLLEASVRANMNMLRVWGGGIYERDIFYDLCDSLGILVWQDFMFACSTYPGTPEFIESVRLEAEAQVKRLAHRPCLALWCGNNEIEQRPEAILATPETRSAYESLFRKILPEAVALYDGTTSYWPSSPHNPDDPYAGDHNNSSKGDAHYWGVWFGGRPVKNYEKQRFRFCSEFGMQSFPSARTASTICDPSDLDAFSPVMDHRQKNPSGNQIIFDYIGQGYRFPRDYEALAFLSQLNQAYTMKIAVEHFRRQMPYCMGALYWQLNDCWPAISWSSIEFGGRLKILHDYARRFFSPILLSAEIEGDVEKERLNRVKNKFAGATIVLTTDSTKDLKVVEKVRARYRVIRNRDGVILSSEESPVDAEPNTSRVLWKKSATELLRGEAPEDTVLSLDLISESGKLLFRNIALFSRPRLMHFNRVAPEIKIAPGPDGAWHAHVCSPEFKHCVKLETADPRWRFSDNSFDLLPNEETIITIFHPDGPVDTPPDISCTAYDLCY